MFCEKCGEKLLDISKFCPKCGHSILKEENKDLSSKKETKGILVKCLAVFVILTIIALSCYIYQNSLNNSSQTEESQVSVIENQNTPSQTPIEKNDPENDQKTITKTADSINQNAIAPSVVSIVCTDGSNELSGGSGTIIDSTGIILTNAHIIPQDIYGEALLSACVITLPDDKGRAKEIYYGEPVVISSLSKEYDLAFIRITEAYVDDDGIAYGKFPNTFPGAFDSVCVNNDVSLGEPVRIFGYPTISGGGYYLTITDGVVSSIPNDGTIVTSAKIDHGNSGGAAVDKNGCFIGVPSKVRIGSVESLGILISNAMISEFINRI